MVYLKTERTYFTPENRGDTYSARTFPVVETAGSIIFLQIHATLVAQQGVLDEKFFPLEQSAGVKLIRGHQRSAKTNAELVLNALCPGFITMISDVESFSRTFEAFALPLDVLLGSATEADKSEALALVSALYEEAAKHGRKAATLNGQVAAMLVKVGADKANLAIDAKTLSDSLTAETGKLAKINQDILSISSSIDSEIVGISASIIGLSAGVVMLAVGGLVTIATAGLATGLIVGGITAVVAGTTGLITASVLLHESNTKLARLFLEAAACNTLVAASMAMNLQLAAFANAVNRIEVGVLAMQKEWESVMEGLVCLKENLSKNRVPSSTLRSDLKATLADWRGVGNQATSMAGKLTTLTIKEVDDILALSAAS